MALFEWDGDDIDGGGVCSGAGCINDETLGGFGVDTGIGPFDDRLGDGLGTGIIDELPTPPKLSVGVGVGGIPLRLLLLLNTELLLVGFIFCCIWLLLLNGEGACGITLDCDTAFCCSWLWDVATPTAAIRDFIISFS